jgi:hypothetical protein
MATTASALVGIEDPSGVARAASLRRMRWAILLAGLFGAVSLVVFILGAIPGWRNVRGTAGTIGVLAGAVFVGGAAIGAWLLWTRVANTRTKRVALTSDGVVVEFVSDQSVRLDWSDPELRLRLRFFDSARAQSAVLLWGTGKMGEYASITRAGAETVQAEATGHGFQLKVAPSGKPSSGWREIVIARS